VENTKRINLLLTPDLWARLAVSAANEGQSRADFVREALQDACGRSVGSANGSKPISALQARAKAAAKGGPALTIAEAAALRKEMGI
jgi:hypothetical protein